MMTCDEFEALGPDFSRDAERAADAQEHLARCPRCSALHDSWQELGGVLREMARTTRSAETPLHVELFLREAVHGLRSHSLRRRLLPLWTWGLAVTAAVAVLVVWAAWRTQWFAQGPVNSTPPIVTQRLPVAPPVLRQPSQAQPPLQRGVKSSETPPAQKRPPRDRPVPWDAHTAADDFVALPYSSPVLATDDATIVRVRMQRAALGALGFPVNEERADEWVMVDLLVGADGEPQAVRLSR